MKTSPLLYVACLCAVCAALSLTGATTWADEPGESGGADQAQPSDDTQTADAEPNETEKAGGPYALPKDADPAKLIEFIETLQQMRPHGLEESREMRTKRPPAIIAAADKILAGDATDDQALTAAKAKVTTLRYYRSDPTSQDKLRAFINKMKLDKRPAISSYAYSMDLLEAASNWAGLGEKAHKEFFADVRKAFATDSLDVDHLHLAMNIGNSLELGGNEKAAAKFFTEIGPLFKANSSEALSEYGEMCEGTVRRMNLPGKEMEITGQLLDGSTFDWGAYKGKVVLVDFWATWCPPCVAEIPNILKDYEQYHDKGFDVVGISLDANKAALEKFVQERKIPWTILFNGDPKAKGGNHPTATYYGIMAVPTTILVDREGKVVFLHTGGGPALREPLGAELEKLLGKPEPAEPEKEAVDSEKTEETKSDS